MKILYLVRHAKSSWAIEDIADKDRPLKGRGIRDAHLISTYFGKTMNELMNIRLCSSSATRALHTALIFAQNFGIPAGQIRLVDELYHCAWEDIHEEVKRTEDEVDILFLFAHNPSITEYVNEITNADIKNVPTTGVTGIGFDSNRWSTIPKQGKCMLFEYPKRFK